MCLLLLLSVDNLEYVRIGHLDIEPACSLDWTFSYQLL